MSQITLTNTERVQALKRLGYNEREASFLLTAALHSGYFLRRQYGEFIGRQDGGSITQLIDKALDFGHVQVATYRANINIYHLAARPFYAALGQEDNRNRRQKEPSTIKAKVMGLDFVLANPNHQYLGTEQEKLDYFTGTLEIEKNLMPAKRYANNGQTTTRYFVEKYPLFLTPSAQPAMPPVVSFCFVDEGSTGISGFQTFLNRYDGVLRSLRESQVIYVAGSPKHFQAAATTFSRFSSADELARPPAQVGAVSPRMLEHFERRKLYETEKWRSFDRAKLIQLRNEREEFSGPEIEAIYQRWKGGRGAAVLEAAEQKEPSSVRICSRFSTSLLEHSYDLFGNLTAY